MIELKSEIRECVICADRFKHTKTAHKPRPVLWARQNASILIAGQAPGARVHKSGIPFDDPSGDRLRDWLGVSKESFYDKSKFAVVPMAFCFPGYNANGHDLPPPAICASTWRKRVLAKLNNLKLTILVGVAAQNWHFQNKLSMTQRVKDWDSFAPETFVLPHPSWRNSAWLKKHPFFERDVVPALKDAVQNAIQAK